MIPGSLEDVYELSPMQQGMLFHTLYDPASDVYFEQCVVTIRGGLDYARFAQAWQRVAARHAILRTSFHWDDLEKPVQVVHREAEVPVESHDWRGVPPDVQQSRLDGFLQADRERGFDLSEAPLIRVALLQTGEHACKFVLSFQHLLLDRWSRFLLLKEVFALYKADCDGEEAHLQGSRPYGDYIAWLQQQDRSEAEEFWRRALQGFTTPTPLRVGRAPAGFAWTTYDEQKIPLSAAATAKLRSFARRHRLTLNTLAQGAWAVLLSRYSGEADVLFGATVAGRPAALPDVESMVGLFINTLPVRVKVPSEDSVLSWLGKLQDQLVELRQYEYSSLVDIQGWSEVPRGLSLFESILVFENTPVDESSRELGGGLELASIHSVHSRTNYPLTVLIVPGRELSLRISYDCRQFDRATMTRMLGHYQTVLEGIVANPERRVSDLPLLPNGERHRVLEEWNDSRADYARDLCIHQLFEAQVERTPDALAVKFGVARLTYRELNRRSNQLAHYLRKHGVGPDTGVGICVERSLEMVVGLLGVLKAGGACVPMDPDYPRERLAFMLSNARAPVFLTGERQVAPMPESAAVWVRLGADGSWFSQESCENPVSGVTAENLAYVLYTSGSTGTPKGVAMGHRPLVNLISWQLQNAVAAGTAKTLQFASLSFDVSFQEIFSTWCSGGTLVLVSEELRRDSVALLRLLDEEEVERLFLPVVALQQLAEVAEGGGALASHLREIITAGEQLQITPEIVEFLKELRSCTLYNHYGPTETHVVTAFTLTGSPGGWPSVAPIGRPVANAQVYLLDGSGRPVPIGVPGELHIGGVALSRGYLSRPDLTAEKFIPDPFSGGPGARLYKTGDLARFRPDGNIEFLGRMDRQVKIRGFRIELGEIEAVLGQHPEVRESVVLAREDQPGEKRLVAYLVVDRGRGPRLSELRSFLKQKLPEYMVPSAFVTLEALPLTPSGKLDRRALPVPEQTRPELEEKLVAPRTPVEEVLAGIWAQVLGVGRVGIDDNFFELGGHSLLATRVVSRIRETFKVEVPLRSLFDAPTLSTLAIAVAQCQAKASEEGEISRLLTELKNLSEEEARRRFVTETRGEVGETDPVRGTLGTSGQ